MISREEIACFISVTASKFRLLDIPTKFTSKLAHYPATKKHEAGAFSQQILEDKFEIRNKYITFVKAATEGSEQILLKLDKLLLEISGLDCV